MEKKRSTHKHFIVWAAQRIEPGTGNYVENVTIDLIVESAEEALAEARMLAPDKAIYTLRQVIEHFNGQSCR